MEEKKTAHSHKVKICLDKIHYWELKLCANRDWLKSIVESRKFEGIVLAIIITNSIIIGSPYYG